MIRTVFLLFLWMLPLLGYGQESTQDIPSDSSQVTVRSVDANTLEDLTSSRTFEYNEVPQNPDSLWSRIRTWLLQTIGKIFQNKWAGVFIRIAFIGLFITAVIAIINQILGGKLSSSFSGKKAEESLSLNISEEELQEQDLDAMLDRSLSENNYKDAVRIIYLKALKELAAAELIHWKADKTNSDYLLELADHPAKPSFSRLTYFYEYVEYGDFEIDKNGFQKVQNIYQSLTINK